MTLNELSQRLERDLRPIYLVTGDARPLVLDAVQRIERAALARTGPPAFNHDAVRCTEDSAQRAIAAARMPPMMGEYRVVVVRELDAGTDDFFTSLVDYLGAPSPTTVLLLTGPRLPKQEKGRPAWARTVKAAVDKAGGELVELDSKKVDSRSFATDRARLHGKRLQRDAASLLVETVGDDLDRLSGEIDKLALYVGEQEEIGVDAVRESCALLAEADVWDLTAALAARDRARTIEVLYRLLSDGSEPRALLGMIAWQSRVLLEAAELARGGARDDAIRRATRMRWDTFKRVKPLLPDGIPAAEELLRQLAAANRDMNSHRGGADRILDALVLEMLT